MQTFYLPGPRSCWYRDNGYWTTAKFHDEKITYPLDFADLLDSGETISSHTWDTSGPTITPSTLASTTVTATVLGTGTAKLKLTTSTGIRIVNFRWRDITTGKSDYRE